MKKRQLTIVIAIVLVLVAGLASGCGPPPVSDFGETIESDTTISVANENTREVSLDDIKSLQLGGPRWRRTIEDLISLSISPDGNLVSVLSETGPSWRRRPQVVVFSQEGERIWKREFSSVGLFDGRVKFIGDGSYLGVLVLENRNNGDFRLFDSSGELQWSTPTDGFVTMTMAEASERVAILDHASETLTIYDVEGQYLKGYRASPGATLQFIEDGTRLLVADDRRVFLLDEKGKIVWQYSMDQDLQRHVTISRDGNHIAVTTGEGDNMIYMFDADGETLWSSTLFVGGQNEVKFSQDGKRLLVYDVGRRSGVYAFQTSSGELLWRRFFTSSAESTKVPALARVPGGKMLVHMNEKYDREGDRSQCHWLIIMDEGAIEGKAKLGEGVEVSLAELGRALVVVDSNESSNGQNLKSTVTYYFLANLLDLEEKDD